MESVEGADRGQTGHRVCAHTADVILEAWAPTRSSCLEQGVYALVASFADPGDVSPTAAVPVALGPTDPAELFASALEEVIFLVDARGVVPVRVELLDAPDGGVAGTFAVASLSAVVVVGSPPKGVSRSGLALEETRSGRWHGHAIVDV